MKDKERLMRGELIGLHIKVIGKNIEGKIVDETKNCIIVQTKDKKTKMVIKKSNKLEFNMKNKKIVIDGRTIALKPEDRIKIRLVD